jgi:hypothetical protein
MNDVKQIRQAVTYQLEHYPVSRLTDIYKNFFQDFYGPGHLLGNPDRALNYLQRELEEVDSCTLHQPIEGTGYKNTFVRVDLCVIREGKISYEDFARLFIESAESFRLPEIEEWKSEWEKILRVIEGMELEILNFEEDKLKIREMIEKGEYVIHHSREYIEAYDPHYRIIKKELVERYL